MKFTEEQLENAIIELLAEKGYPHIHGKRIDRSNESVVIEEDLRKYLRTRYTSDNITNSEINTVINKIDRLPASDLYSSNKKFIVAKKYRNFSTYYY